MPETPSETTVVHVCCPLCGQMLVDASPVLRNPEGEQVVVMDMPTLTSLLGITTSHVVSEHTAGYTPGTIFGAMIRESLGTMWQDLPKLIDLLESHTRDGG